MACDCPADLLYHPVTGSIEAGGTYISGIINFEGQGVSSQTRMIIDQGNQVPPGLMISEELFRILGLEYTDRSQVRLQTAAEGCEIWTLGWSSVFCLEIEGITPRFCGHAVVANRLAEDVNLGTLFLQQVSTLNVEV